MKKIIITIILVIVVIITLFGSYYIYSSNNSSNDINALKLKVNEEMNYLNTKIISLMNKFNNISYANYKIVEEVIPSQEKGQQDGSSSGGGESKQSSGGSGSEGQESQSGSNTITNMNMDYSSILVNPSKKVEWDDIKKDIEQMYSTWTTILIDLNALNVNRDNLLKYNVVLDRITQSLDQKNKENSLIGLADLYSLIGGYVKDYSDDTKLINLYNTKSNVLYAYALAEQNNWNEMKNSIKKAQNAYGSIINSGVQNSNNIINMNKSYVLLNEIEKSIDKKDRNIFYINYKNLMQELEILGE